MEKIKIEFTVPEAKFTRNVLQAVVTFLSEFKIFNDAVVSLSAIVTKMDEELLKK